MANLGGFLLGSEMLSPNCIIVIDSACNNCHYELQAAFCDQISNSRKFKLNSSHCVVEFVRGQGLTCKPLAACMVASVPQVIYISQHLSYELRDMINVQHIVLLTTQCVSGVLYGFSAQEHHINHFYNDKLVLFICGLVYFSIMLSIVI